MFEKMKKHSIVILAVVWMLVVVAGASSAITMSLMGAFNTGETAPLLDSSVRVDDQEYDMIQRYARLDEVRATLKESFYQELNDDDLVLGAIRGMMASTEDPYTFYYTPEEMIQAAKDQQGVYEGVGLQLSADKDGYLTVLRVFEGTPAVESGIKPGDRIIEVNGTPVSAKNDQQMDEAIRMIKGSENPSVVVTVRRKNKTLEITLTKTKVSINRIEYKMLENKIGYISIFAFMGDDVTGFEKALKALKDDGMKALVIDIRNNPGGLLDHVVSIADLLLPKGLIVYTEDRYERREEHYSKDGALDLPMVVLVNGMSASASEILAGSIQDYGVGTIVGTKTFGKGIVQSVIPFRSDDAGMQLTIARYFTPNGRSIHGTGIIPDVEVHLPDGADPTDIELNPEHDLQLIKALEILNKKIK